MNQVAITYRTIAAMAKLWACTVDLIRIKKQYACTFAYSPLTYHG